MNKLQPTINTYDEDTGLWLLCAAYMHYCDEGGALSPQQWNTIVNEQVEATYETYA